MTISKPPSENEKIEKLSKFLRNFAKEIKWTDFKHLSDKLSPMNEQQQNKRERTICKRCIITSNDKHKVTLILKLYD